LTGAPAASERVIFGAPAGSTPHTVATLPFFVNETATTAAVLSGALKVRGPTVLVVSGGNVDPALLQD